jgi:hypothetical protein
VRYTYCELGSDEEKTITEKEILTQYWEYWLERTQGLPESERTQENCIEDWVILHWATPLPE